MPPLESPGLSQASLGQSLVGALLLSPGSWGTQGSVWAPQESISQSCVSLVGLMATSSKRAYVIPRAAAPVHCWPLPPQETLRHSSVSVSVGSLGPYANKPDARFVWALWTSLVGMEFGSKCDFTPLNILLGLLLCSWMWGISSQSPPHHAE